MPLRLELRSTASGRADVVDGFRVDPTGMWQVGSRLSDVASQLAAVTPSVPLDDAAGAAGGSATGAAAGRLSGQVSGRLIALLGAVGSMSAAASATAANYIAADRHGASLLGPLAPGLPTPVAAPRPVMVYGPYAP